MAASNDENVMQLLGEFKNAAVANEKKNAKKLLIEHQQLAESVCEIIFEKHVEQQEMETLCHELLTFYYYGGSSKCFCVQFLPVLIGTYLLAISEGNRKHCVHMETLLLSIYNNEVSKQVTNESATEEIRLASLVQPSIYHKDPSSLLSGTVLIENSVDRAKSSHPVVVKIGPYPSCANLNAENRYLIITRLWRQFNAYLNFINPSLLTAACRIIVLLCHNGVVNRHSERSSVLSKCSTSGKEEAGAKKPHWLMSLRETGMRIGLHPALLQEMVISVHFALYTKSAIDWASSALKAVHCRALYELYGDVLLITSAMLNASDIAVDRDKSASPSSMASTSGSSPSNVCHNKFSNTTNRRQLVTNASLRIRKLPEDITCIEKTVPHHKKSFSNPKADSLSPLDEASESSPNPLSSAVAGDLRLQPCREKSEEPVRPGSSQSDKRSAFFNNPIVNIIGRGGAGMMTESVSAVDLVDLQKRAQQAEMVADMRHIVAVLKPQDFADGESPAKFNAAERGPSFIAMANGDAPNFIDDDQEYGYDTDGFRLKTPPFPPKSKKNGNGTLETVLNEQTHF